MTTMKVAVSVPREILQRAKRAVRHGRAASLSAYVTAALEQKATFDELDAMHDAMLEESGGPMKRAEAKQVDRLLGIEARGRARRPKKP